MYISMLEKTVTSPFALKAPCRCDSNPKLHCLCCNSSSNSIKSTSQMPMANARPVTCNSSPTWPLELRQGFWSWKAPSPKLPEMCFLQNITTFHRKRVSSKACQLSCHVPSGSCAQAPGQHHGLCNLKCKWCKNWKLQITPEFGAKVRLIWLNVTTL